MKKGSYERMSMNYPIQAGSASITKIACIYVYREIEKQNAFWKVLFPNVIHDQIILEVPEEEKQQWSDTVRYCMEKAGEPFCKTVKLRAEPEQLYKWKK
jgi:DNA polymerase I-like protein with 3'-5' exonuclease and polymerase domains